MNSKITKNYDEKNSELKITVPVESKLWKEEQKKSFDKLSKKIKIKGYRTGKVPVEIAKKYISSAEIWEDAINKLINIVVKDAVKEIDEKKDIILDSPTYSVEKISNDEVEIIFIYPIYPDFKVDDWTKYKIKYKEPSKEEIKDSVENQINNLLSRGTLLLPKEGDDAKVEKGDTIIFDFKGFMDGKAFENGSADNFELKIGSNTFIPGFEDQLIGKKLGWEGSIKVKFPNNYFKEEFRDKDAEFKIKIHEIKYNDKQTLNEDFIKSLNIKDVKTEQDLNNYLSDLTKREITEKNRDLFMNDFVAEVIKNNEIPTPRTIVLKELQALLKKFDENLKNQGFTKKDYFDATGYNEEKVKKELNEEAIRAVKKSFIYSKLSKDLKIKPNDEDFYRQYEKIGKLYNIDPQTAYEMIKKEQIESPLINELLIDHVIKTLNPEIKIEKEKVSFQPKKEKETDNKKE